MSIKIISRGKGKSAIAAAAYRAGEKITNEYDGEIHDFIKKGGITHTEILLPDHAPREYFDRGILWNAVEKIEKNCNSQLSYHSFGRGGDRDGAARNPHRARRYEP